MSEKTKVIMVVGDLLNDPRLTNGLDIRRSDKRSAARQAYLDALWEDIELTLENP